MYLPYVYVHQCYDVITTSYELCTTFTTFIATSYRLCMSINTPSVSLYTSQLLKDG